MRLLEVTYCGRAYDVRFDYYIEKDAQGKYPVEIETVRDRKTQGSLSPDSLTYHAVVKEALPKIQAELSKDEKELSDEDFFGTDN